MGKEIIVSVDSTKYLISEEYLGLVASEFLGEKLEIAGSELDKMKDFEFKDIEHKNGFENALKSFLKKE